MARWEALQKADYASESRSIERDVASAEETEKKKSGYSGVLGTAGAVIAPLAFSALTGGASMALPSLMAAVGVGSLGGRLLGSALGGQSKDIGGGTFFKSDRAKAQSLINQSGKQRRKDILWGAVKDAGTAGFVKAGGMDAFKEIGAKSLTKLVGEDAASSLYKASGMMAPGEKFGDILEGTKTEDMWSDVTQGFGLGLKPKENINPMSSATFTSANWKDIMEGTPKAKADLEAAKESLISEKMKARTHDPSMFGMDNFEKQTYQDSLKGAKELGDKNLKLAEQIKESQGLKGIVRRDVEAGRKLYGENPYDEEALRQSQLKHLFRSPMQKPTTPSVPVQNAQSMLNQTVSMYNQATGGAISNPPVSGLSPRGEAFRAARERGDKSFWFEGMEYNTKLAEEQV